MSDNPYLARRNQHRIGKSGRKSEVRVARQIGARPRPASGAIDSAKGDMVLGDQLIEAKSTTRASLGLKFSWLSKIAREARSEGKMPVMTISFIKESGEPELDGEWCLIPMHRYREICN